MLRSAIVALVGVSAACAGDDGPLEPVGTWAVSLRYDTGTCGLENETEDATFSVTEGRTGLYQINTQGTSALQGRFECSVELCHLSASSVDVVTVEGVTVEVRFSANLTLHSDGEIDGDGLITMVGGIVCSQQFTYSGELR